MRTVVACGAAVFLLLLGVAMIVPEAAKDISFFLGLASFLLFLASVLGLINPRLVGLPGRVGSVGVWFASAIVFATAVALDPSPSERPTAATRRAPPSATAEPTTPSPRVAEPPTPRRASPEGPQPLVAEVRELLEAFEENEVRAHRIYGDRPIQVTGVVGSIEQGAELFGGGGSILFEDGWFRKVAARFTNEDPLFALSRRDLVTVLCQDTDGGDLGVALHDCELVSGIEEPAR